MKFLRLYVFVLTSLMLLSSCSDIEQEEQPAKGGELNLSKIKIDEGHSVLLDGEWEFYWKQLLTPDDFKTGKPEGKQIVNVPSPWTSYKDGDGNVYPAKGYATYRLRCKVPQGSVGLFVPKIWTSSKVWVNGNLVSSRGVVSKDLSSANPQFLEKLVMADIPDSGEAEIIVQVACPQFFVAGLLNPFEIGSYESLLQRRELTAAWAMVWLGALVIMWLYHLILYLFRKKNPSTLYFSFIAFFTAIRFVIFGEHFFYEFIVLNLEWSNYQAYAYYISIFALIPCGLLYLQSLYPDETDNRWVKGSRYLVGTFIVLALIIPSSWYTSMVRPFLIIMIPFMGYMLWILIRASLRKRPETRLQVAGILTMLLAGINDVVYVVSPKDAPWSTGELMSYAFGIFLLLQIVIIAKRFSGAFKNVEDLTENLEQKVKKRTEEVSEKSRDLERQRDEIQYKNRQITDSIRYAKRIQKSVLGSTDNIKAYFDEAFIFFKPRDIVSGDFYWVQKCPAGIMVAAVDCTGHGVPGAFMTVMGTDFLNEIFSVEETRRPSAVLNALDSKVKNALRRNLEADAADPNDGMDMSLVSFDPGTRKMVFSGAKNPVWIVRKDEVIQIKGSPFPIGSRQYKKEKVFKEHELQLEKDDMVYLFSDGFQDQFGGEKNRKYMRKRFREFLKSISLKPVEDQKAILADELKQWKGSYPQTDDVLVIGFRVN